jgi:hypothetical protein
MEIEKQSDAETPTIKFKDDIGSSCCIWLAEKFKGLYFGLENDYGLFTQEDIKDLLPYLQSFAETGQLEPATESTLQGGSLAEAFKPENLIKISADQNVKLYEQERKIEELEKGRAYYLRQCDQYVDQVAELEEVIEKWRNAVERGMEASSLNELQVKTKQILGEE